MGDAAQLQGNYPRAASLYKESLALQREVGDKQGIAYSLMRLGGVARDQGDGHQALALLRESLVLFRAIGAKWGIASALRELGSVIRAQGNYAGATRLFGAAEVLREATGASLPPNDRAVYDRDVAAMRSALGEEPFSSAWAQGRAMTIEQAIEFALHFDITSLT